MSGTPESTGSKLGAVFWTVVSAVAVAIAVALVAAFFHPGAPKVIVASLNESGSYGSPATAQIDIQNNGSATATNCILYWDTGVYLKGTQIQKRSVVFALDQGKELTFNFATNNVNIGFRTTTDIDAFVNCDNGNAKQVNETFTPD